MTVNNHVLPIINLDRYTNPTSPADKEKVIAEVREASGQYGFFQVKGHSVPLGTQREFFQGLSNLFSLPKEEKLKLSFLKDNCRRGYEASGDTHREGDALPDSKEVQSPW